MDAIWQVALSNAALVAAGTPIVWAVGRFARRPALTHALAVVLLLKLITPPLWRVPVAWPEQPASATAPNETTAAAAELSKPVQDAADSRPQFTASSELRPLPEAFVAAPIAAQAPARIASAPTPASLARYPVKAVARWRLWRQWAVPAAQWAWAAGAAICLLIAMTRIARFGRALRFAVPATYVQPRANLLARRLGLRRAPAVWFVPGFVSPMLWSLGRSRLLLPAALWERLDVIERDTILLHELAHWRRGDPVIRWIELLATCLYWWHPACWWARRELREAEEQCCDAWVLWAMPGTFKNYANALLEAVEFVSVGADRPSARSAVPALASRMGQFVHLRRRLTMLKHGNIARALSWGGLAGVLTLGSFLLPVAPTWGQDRPAEPAAAPDPFARPDDGAKPLPAPAADERREAVQRADAELQEKAAEMKRAQAEAEQARWAYEANRAGQDSELQQALRTIQELRQKLEAAQARIAALEGRGGFDPEGGGLPPAMPSLTPPAPPRAPEYPGTAAPGPSRGEKFEYWIKPGGKAQIRMRDGSVEEVTVAPPAGNSLPGVETAPGVHDGQYRVVITDPTTGRIKEIQTRPLDRPANLRDASQAERLDKIEAQLQALMGELHKMREAGRTEPAR